LDVVPADFTQVMDQVQARCDVTVLELSQVEVPRRQTPTQRLSWKKRKGLSGLRPSPEKVEGSACSF